MIELRGVTKIYRGLFGADVTGLRDVTLDMGAGEVVGLAGPNGSGKSTLINLLLGYLHPTSGTVRIAGQAPRSYAEREGVSYLSELVAIPPRWRTETALVRYATLAGIAPRDIPAAREGEISRHGLAEHRRKKVKALSKGTLQRLGLAQSLLRECAVTIFDEPTHGLDPIWTVRFRDLVRELRAPDRAIVIASHNLDELERLADRVVILDGGTVQRIVGDGMPSSRAGASHLMYRISATSGLTELESAFPGAARESETTIVVQVTDPASLSRALAEAIGRGAVITAVAPTHSALEREFRDAVGERGE